MCELNSSNRFLLVNDTLKFYRYPKTATKIINNVEIKKELKKNFFNYCIFSIYS